MIDFETDVLEKSNSLPVVVDFWAPWCGPCRVLGPVMERLAEEQDGKWALVKLNTEDQPEPARQYRVMSIPNVKMFHRREVIAEFAGALPRTAIEEWLQENLPSADQIKLEDILAAQRDWPDHEIAQKLTAFLIDHPENRAAKLALARHIVLSAPDRAVALAAELPATVGAIETRDDIRTLAEVLSFPGEGDVDLDTALHRLGEMLRSEKIDAAGKLLVDITMRNKSYAEDLPRRAGIALFRMLGSTHPVTKQYRKLFDMALY